MKKKGSPGKKGACWPLRGSVICIGVGAKKASKVKGYDGVDRYQGSEATVIKSKEISIKRTKVREKHKIQANGRHRATYIVAAQL